MSGDRAKRSSSDVRNSVIVGGLAAIFVAIVGVYFSFSAAPSYTAESSAILLPSTDLGPAQESSYYEYLSRGQIIATFAEVGNNPQLVAEAEDALGMSEADRAQSSVSLTVVPSTSVVLAVATAPTSDQAVALANTTMELASKYLKELAVPFRAQVVPAEAPASASGPAKSLMLMATVVAAFVTGVAVQQVVLLLLRSRGQRKKDEAADTEQVESVRSDD